jgi:hypothetical protein
MRVCGRETREGCQAEGARQIYRGRGPVFLSEMSSGRNVESIGFQFFLGFLNFS